MLFWLLNRIYGYLLFVTAFAFKFHSAVYQSKQGIVSTDAHIQARMDLGAALTDENVAAQHELAIAALSISILVFG